MPPPVDLFDRPFGDLLRAALEALVMADERQNVVAVNPAAEQLFGCSAAELLSRPLGSLIPLRHQPAHAAWVQAFTASPALQQRLAERRPITALRADGVEIAVEIKLSPVDLVIDGQARHFVAALLLDLAEPGALRAELARYKDRVREVFELVPAAIWIAEADRVVFANRAARQLFGGGRDLVGEDLSSLLGAPLHASVGAQMARSAAGENDTARVSGRITGADGSRRDVEIALAALPDHDRTTVQMVVSDVTQRQREIDALHDSRAALRQLSTRLVEAREDERRRIARELHDELGQHLTALKMGLSTLAAADRQSRPQRVDGMLATLDETIASVRRIATDLRPMLLDDLGLNAAIEWLARDAARRIGIEVTLRLDEADPPVDDRMATALFRMVQEALSNVARHAHATDARVTLRRVDGELQLTVDDNGIGPPEHALQREGSFGLLGLRERAEMFGGRLEFGNAPGRGARLSVRLPLAPAATAPQEDAP